MTANSEPIRIVSIANRGIIVGSLALFGYAAVTTVPELQATALLPFGFQLACWVGAFMVLNRRSPQGTVRLSNPAALVLLWCGLYLILPTIFWMQGQRIPFETYLVKEVGIELLWVHGLFIIAFIGGYLVVRPPRLLAARSLDLVRLPQGWALLILPMLPLLLEIVVRLVSGGGLLPTTTYGENWLAGQEVIQASRSEGGLSYILTQITSKVWFYPLLLQGISLGLLLTRAWHRRQNRVLAFVFGASLIGVMLVFGGGERSAPIIVLLIGLFLTDILAGPIKWRYVVALGAAGLLVFDFMGTFRTNRNLGFSEARTQSLESYTGTTNDRLGEFTGMLPKEAFVVTYVRESPANDEGLNVLWQGVLALVPSQLVPGKVNWEGTANLLSRELLGSAYYSGAGTAGAMLADGIRLGGVWGVTMLATLLGLLLGGLERWVARPGGVMSLGSSVLKLGLWAGLLGWTWGVLRSDLGGLLVIIVYNLVLPWLALRTFLRPSSSWVTPIAMADTAPESGESPAQVGALASAPGASPRVGSSLHRS